MKDIWACYVVLWIIDQYTLFGSHGLPKTMEFSISE